jgi:hypothetical protein
MMVGRANRALRWFGLLTALVASSAGATGDADIYALIDTLRPVAEAITVDGNPSDWGAIPAYSDPSGDAGDGSRRPRLRPRPPTGRSGSASTS